MYDTAFFVKTDRAVLLFESLFQWHHHEHRFLT